MQSRKPNTECAQCHIPIYRRPHELATNPIRFCTKRCQAEYEKPTLSCAQCGGPFRPVRSRGTYCSSACSNRARRGTGWRKSHRFRSPTEERMCRLRAEFDFTSCMVEDCEYATTYDVHRLVPGAQGGGYKIGNMFAICPNHHAEVTRGLIALIKVNDHTLRIDNPMVGDGTSLEAKGA